MTQQAISNPLSLIRYIRIPAGIIFLQCLTFVVLYSVWILPEIASWRNTSLVIGAVLGLYVSYQYRFLLLDKKALPIWLIGILFIWAVFHLLFLSQNPDVQLIEFKGIWKRALLAVIFALGLGLSIANNTERIKKWAWPLIYLGLLMPTLIYLLKWFLTFYGEVIFGFGSVPISMRIYVQSQPFYVPKSDYVVFCLPILALALGQLSTLLRARRINWRSLLIYSATISAVTFLFYFQRIKNGIAYEFILTLLFLVIIFRNSWRTRKWNRLIIAACVMVLATLLMIRHIQEHDSWRSFIEDAKVAVQLERYHHWRENGEKGLPLNGAGEMVSGTNYVRIAWGLVGFHLLLENPYGFGLIENSFGPLVNKKWPESSPNLSHSHSGWLDLALGLGLPGIILVLGALVYALKEADNLVAPWQNLGKWVLISILLLWCTTEVSNNGNFEPLLFWIVLTTSLALRIKASLGNDRFVNGAN